MRTTRSRALISELGLLTLLAFCLSAAGCNEHKQLDYAAALSQDGSQSGTNLAHYYGRVAQHIRDNERMQEVVALENAPVGSVDRALKEIHRLADTGPSGLNNPPLVPAAIPGVPALTLTTYGSARKNADALAEDLGARQQMAQAVAGLYASMHDIAANKPDDVDHAILDFKAAVEKVNGHPLHISAAGQTLADPLVNDALTGLANLILDAQKLRDARQANEKIYDIVTRMNTVYVREEKYLVGDDKDYYTQEYNYALQMKQAGVANVPDPSGAIDALGVDFGMNASAATSPQGQSVIAIFQLGDMQVRLDNLLAKAQADATDSGSRLSLLIRKHQRLAQMLGTQRLGGP